jgi:hypothetical protein
MKIIAKRIPWFYIFFTVYPLLFLWATNVSEIYASELPDDTHVSDSNVVIEMGGCHA